MFIYRNYSVVARNRQINDRLSYDGSTGAAAPCLPLWGRCPSAHTGADEVGTHRRFVPVPSKRKSCCPALFFPSMVLYAHTGLGAFQPHPTRLTPGHLPQRGRLWYAKRSFTLALHLRSRGSKDVRLPPKVRNAFAAGLAR